MKRDTNRLTDGTYDVFVIGGGIHGVAAARAAALAGYRTALTDRSDFCGATSANSLKILHGGLRYLQHGNLKRMRHSIRSRRAMMRLAPHLVRPLPCVMPLYGHGLRGREALQIALWLNDFIAWDRNEGLAGDIRIPRGALVSRSGSLKLVPHLDRKHLRGAAMWFDVLAKDTERLALAFLQSAIHHGCTAANYAPVTEVRKGDGPYYTLTVEDRLTGRFHSVKSRFVINAAGPWFASLLPAGHSSTPNQQHWAMGLNIVVNKRIFPTVAVGLEGSTPYTDRDALLRRGKRLFFFVPWGDHTMIGTDYRLCRESPDTFQVQRDDIERMLEEIHHLHPRSSLSFNNVTWYHAGLLPASSDSPNESAEVQLEKNSSIVVHDQRQGAGLLSIKGVKYTTAPHIAEAAVTKVRKRLRPRKTSYSAKTEPAAPSLRIDADASVVSNEVIDHFIDEEMAITLGDIVFRRTNLGAVQCPSLQTLTILAERMAHRLEWTPEKVRREIRHVKDRYALLQRP